MKLYTVLRQRKHGKNRVVILRLFASTKLNSGNVGKLNFKSSSNQQQSKERSSFYLNLEAKIPRNLKIEFTIVHSIC